VIIDAHTHIWDAEMAPVYWLKAMIKYGAAISGRTEESVENRIVNDWYDNTGDLLVSDMNAAGIDKSLVFALDMGLATGVDDSISVVQRHRHLAEIVNRHSDRLILVGGIDPRRPDARDFVQRAVDEFGIAALKIWPPAGVVPNEACCYRVYEKCADLGLPVIVHTGQEIGPLQSDTTRPINVDRPASDFPEVKFVLAHAGMAWWEEAADIAWHHSNVYLDIAYWQTKYLKNERLFRDELKALISGAGAKRVFFGSDWPAMRTVARAAPKAWMDVLQGLTTANDIGSVALSQEELALLLGGAASQVFRI